LSNLRVQVVKTESEFASLGEQWQQLAAIDKQATLFNDWSWNSLWWEHYKHLGELHVVLVYKVVSRKEQLVGIGPFYRCRSKAMFLGTVDNLRFIGTGGDTSPDDLNILAHPSLQKEVAGVVCEHLFGEQFQRILLSDVSQRSAFYRAFKSSASSASGYARTPVVHTRRFADLPGDWSAYRAQISRNTHKQIKRRQNRLNALGNVEIKLCRTEREVESAFDALVRLHVSRWQSRGHSGSFGSERYCRFHQALMRNLFLEDQLWLITLEVDNDIIAVEYLFLYKQTLLFFQTGFSPEFEHLSPGHVLIAHAIQLAIESGVRRIDLLKGNYSYKSSYANQILYSADIGYYAKGLNSVFAKVKDQRLQWKKASWKSRTRHIETH